MFKNRFLVILGAISLLLVTMAVSKPLSNASPDASDFHQRHLDWTWAINDQNVVIPVTGDSAFLDYDQRHPELSAPAEVSVDVTDYFDRHIASQSSPKTVDLADYFFHHH